ncbi:ankyrin repeat domain-containing protein [Flavobacterium ardleyense]|uniref:Ankyrin repeat domain-containing protein n=1 Tax=Flavobacterium ardleyense TaxID=2038737 RepID=A0ABW5Z6A4_9FLAO
MKKILFSTLLLVASIANGQNTLLSSDFWKKKPDLTLIKETIAKGNSPSEANGGNFDAVTMAINSDASLESILFLIQQDGNSVKKLTHDGRTYLHWAANKGNVDLVKILLEKGAAINLSDDKGAIPLAFAAANGQANPKLYELFFKAGNNPKQKYKNGANLLLLSIPNDKELKLADYLATKGLSLKDTDDLGNTAFNYASRSGDVKLLQNLLKKGVKYDGRALIIASQGTRASSATLEAYKYLVEDLKINPNSLGDEGENVLHNLVRKQKQEDIIDYFLAKGVDVNHQDKAENSILMNATRANIEVIKPFIAEVKDINVANLKGMTALSFAVENGSPEMVEFLLAKGAKSTVIDSKGNNLAYYLIQSVRRDGKDGFDEKLNLLKNSGFDITMPQKDGNTLYHLAVAKNDLNLFKKITGFGIAINAKNDEGMTALHKVALTAKDDSLLHYLISAGANKDIKTEFDETAYDLAKENESLTASKTAIDFLR